MDKLRQRLTIILRRRFGFRHFRPGQAAVLSALVRGNNVLAVLPTGDGKTLIYQLYGCLERSLILIVSPLLSLMQDQVSRMQYLGFKNVVALNSLLGKSQKNYVLNHLERYHYLYISPEMLAQPRVQTRLKSLRIGLVVIDEVHCVSQWGVDFRPEYLSLKSTFLTLDSPQVLMLTATASSRLRRDILSKLGFHRDQVKEVVRPVNRPNIFLDVKLVKSSRDKDLILARLVEHLKAPGIIYFSSKRQASQVANWLESRCDVRAEAYHSGLNSASRYRIQHQFMNNQIDVICATSAFGMGIDKDDVRYVIHYHLPANLGIYMQEIGRAGRDGRQSIAILLYCKGDEELPKTLINNEIPNVAMIKHFFQQPREWLRYRNRFNQVAILDYYWQHRFSVSQIIKLFSSYRNRCRAELKNVITYVKIKRCKRWFLLRNFNEVAPQHGQLCCNYQTQVNLKQLGLYIVRHHRQSSSSLNWRPVVARLFKNSCKRER